MTSRGEVTAVGTPMDDRSFSRAPTMYKLKQKKKKEEEEENREGGEMWGGHGDRTSTRVC